MLDTFDMTERPGRGPASAQPGAHLPFYDVLEVVSEGWRLLLQETGREDLGIQSFAVAHVDADFRREMFRTSLEVRTGVERIGNSSLTLVTTIAQDGDDTGSAKAVLVRIGPGRTASAAFTDEQRAALAGLLD